MIQASLYVSHCGVGLFHKPFPPPVFLKGIKTNPTHSNPSRSCFVRVHHPILPSEISYLAYNLTTFSRGQTPADNYTNDYYIYINRITKRITNSLSLFALGVCN